jgi:amino acid adenylation domain-containing protein
MSSEAQSLEALAADITGQVAGLSPEERELFELLLRQQGIAASGTLILPRPADDAPPLSYAQQRLWFLDQLEPGDPSYNISTTARLTGPLDAAGLEECLNAVVRRHEALRTAFVADGGDATQVVTPEVRVRLARFDFTSSPEGEREAAALRLAGEDARRPFDLARVPLLRVLLFKLGTAEHLLHLTIHHIVADAWSLGLLIGEVATLYGARAAGRPAKLHDLPLQYADFAVWQRERLRGAAFEAQFAYWEQQLAGPIQPLELPADRPRPPVITHAGARFPVSLPSSLSEQLAALARGAEASLFMALLAAFDALLCRCTGQTDLVVGTPTANRTRFETEKMIGLFINTLPLRVDISGDPTFAELLGRTRAVALGAYANQDVPFEQLIERLKIDRQLSRTPLFQVLFTLQNTPAPSVAAQDLSLEVLDVPTGTSKFDLSLTLVQTPDGLSGFFDYSTDLFEADTIRRLAGHFRRLLEAVVADPQRRVSELPLMDEVERRTVLVEWNRTNGGGEPAECLHRMFEAQSERTPDAVAVVRGDRKMSYCELDAAAEVLARRLRAYGVGAERAVGLCAERSIEMVVGLLAILKAGGAYLPLEPEYPDERLSFMLADSGASVLLAQPRLAPRFADYTGTVVSFDEQAEASEASERGSLPRSVTPENLAYVIYTSGSTGGPKGVQVTHASVCNHLRWRQSAYPLSASDSFLQKASISFDISVWEIFAPLLAGARLVLGEPGGQRDSAYLGRLIAEEQITVAHFHPAMLRAVLQEPDAARWTSLRQVFCGGETLPPETQRLFFDTVRARLCHQYGPTETTIDVAAWDCSPDDARAVIPIGRPISNTRLYVLDGELRPVPVGLPGQLYVGGLALARAYLNRPGLTAERFVPDPFSREPGERLYRTGDHARWLSDGAVQFLGRADAQVKVRGYRVELGEIEAALASHPGVRDAAAALQADAGGEQKLVGYVVLRSEHQPTTSEMREHLKERLPEYMVPSFFVMLDAFPVTASGKVDRRRLPTAERLVAAEASGESPARGPIEEALAGIWAEVLGVAAVGARTNFFELGGHSLLATRVMARVREAFGVEVALRTLFEEPTVEGLGRAVEERLRVAAGGGGGAGEGLGRIEPSERKGTGVELSYGQRRLWFLQRLEPESAAYNLPMSVRLKGELNVEALRWSLGEIVRRHEALRTRITTVEGRPMATVEEDAALSLTLDDLSGSGTVEQREAAARHISLTEAALPFDFERSPLLRCRLLKLADGDHVLSLVMAHVVSDGWSVGVMVREFAAAYEARREARPAALPDLRVQYADWAAWQRRALEGGALEGQLNYWRAQLGGTLPALEVSGDHPRPKTPTGRGGHLRRPLPAELSEGVKALSAAEGVTPFMVLLAAFKVLLYRHTGQEDIVVGTPMANRTRREIEDLVGFFVNMLVLRTRVEGHSTLREILARVKETALGAYANQDVPFEKLVEVLQPARDPTRAPLFQIAFVMQQQAQPPLRGVAGLEIEGAEVEPETARWDLTLVLDQTPSGLTVGAEYSTDLFEAETVERLLRHYERLLGAMVADARWRVSVAPMLTEAERRQLLEWSQAAPPTALPAWRSVPALFAEQARLHPSDVAIEHGGGETLSYAELDQRADALARHLRTLGVGAETLVGLCLERGAEQVVGSLAVLKAGGAYLPLDPAYPRERLAYMAEDSGLKVLVTRRGLAEGFTPQGVGVVFLDEPPPAAAAGEGKAALEPCGVTADNLAYVIYTSGSTGRPRGVALTHGGLSNLVAAQRRAFGVRPQERVLQFASFSFDASVSEFFVTLLAGATLVLGGAESLLPGPALAEFLQRRSVTMATLPPSALANLPRAEAGTLMKLVTAGEPLTPGVLGRWLDDGREIINAYGPTETTVCATVGACDPEDETVTIGCPIDGTEVYILCEDLQPVPAGVTGELYVGGRGLARGYVNHPSLTAEKFIPDPFGRRTGGRLYRTGDLGRWRPDGRVEFIGRRDQQVKLRGFRIELGEVETVLGRHPAVVEAAVVARAEEPHGTRLVAYVVPTPGDGAAAHALLGFLREYLPDYMVPRDYVFLDAFPRTPAGKVDRAALPSHDYARGAAGASYVAPESELERRITDVWRDALRLERVGVDDNFFDLGGHSLLVAQVHGRLETDMERAFPLMLLFKYPTVRSLAGWLEGGKSAEQFSAETIQDRVDLRRAVTARRGESRRATRRAGPERSSR